MPNPTPSVLEVRGRSIQHGYVHKTGVQCRVDFPRPFQNIPTVVITPFWERSGRDVMHTETIGVVTNDHFMLFSDNGGSNYYVSWIAVGYTRAARNSNIVDIGDLVIETGRTAKTDVALTVPLTHPFARPPIVQVSPFWEGQGSGVGHVETIGRVAERSFDVSSDNKASNYYVSWLAVGTGRADLTPEGSPGWLTQDFPVRGGTLVRTIRGRMEKAHASLPTSIGPAFGGEPTVVVSPFWEGQNRGVGHAETIDWIEPHYVGLSANNGASNYFVSMLAIGPR